MTTSRP